MNGSNRALVEAALRCRLAGVVLLILFANPLRAFSSLSLEEPETVFSPKELITVSEIAATPAPQLTIEWVAAASFPAPEIVELRRPVVPVFLRLGTWRLDGFRVVAPATVFAKWKRLNANPDTRYGEQAAYIAMGVGLIVVFGLTPRHRRRRRLKFVPIRPASANGKVGAVRRQNRNTPFTAPDRASRQMPSWPELPAPPCITEPEEVQPVSR